MQIFLTRDSSGNEPNTSISLVPLAQSILKWNKKLLLLLVLTGNNSRGKTIDTKNLFIVVVKCVLRCAWIKHVYCLSRVADFHLW